MIRAILFDLGDTLLDFEPMDTRAVFREGARRSYEHLSRCGCRLPPFPKYCRSQFSAVRWAYFWAKLRGREVNTRRLLRKLCRKLRIQDHEGSLESLAWLWYAPVIEHTSIESDLIATLSLLRARGLKLGLISNTFVPGAVLDRHLRLMGLFDFFPVRVYSSDVGYRKPHAKIFQMALHELGTEPGETIFVGDIVKTDIVGARRVGMKTVLKQPWSNRRDHRVADHVIRRIADLGDLLQIDGIPSAGGEVARFSIAQGSSDQLVQPAKP